MQNLIVIFTFRKKIMNPESILNKLKGKSGTYILVIKVPERITISVGKLSKTPLTFSKGYYLYCGSALGKNGLYNRVRRHFSKEKKIRWHIDYLLGKGKITDVIFDAEPVRKECIYAMKYLESGLSPVPDFGSSDCKCISHLFFDSIGLRKINRMTKINKS
ncbi:MAG: GIY-YIG nuclease family protein [Ignavibacteriales bacterium]|nr:GIY-YIG nuclease family protein [Ignavibacteriales bacterium]